jgi:hypothetical protein
MEQFHVKLCSNGCGNQARKGQRYCKACHAQYMKASRYRVSVRAFAMGFRAAAQQCPYHEALEEFLRSRES